MRGSISLGYYEEYGGCYSWLATGSGDFSGVVNVDFPEDYYSNELVLFSSGNIESTIASLKSLKLTQGNFSSIVNSDNSGGVNTLVVIVADSGETEGGNPYELASHTPGEMYSHIQGGGNVYFEYSGSAIYPLKYINLYSQIAYFEGFYIDSDGYICEQ